VTSKGGSFMFRLKVKEEEHKIIKDRLNVVETPNYDYVLTDDKDLVENDKINIVFNQADIECRNFYYFIVEDEDVYGILNNTKLLIKLKLYEVDELLKVKDFIRISKYCLVNVGKIAYIKPELNSKLNLLMKNDDHVEVNRGYYKEFKKALKI
jgi:DNA-binding LytR/AlgR family response regulator